MAGPIGKLVAVLGLDAKEFSGGISEAEKSLKGFGLNSQTGFKVAGAAAAIGFGLMAKGALEMERAQGEFMAATGRSREEAVKFSKDMNGLVGTAGTVGRSFEEITKTGIAVSQQFGITGEKATKLTGDILTFAKVTGQDAAGAAFQLEDTLSAFNLTADDAVGIMDKLVLSSQKYGTDAGPETLSVLQGMAPALQAMGEDMDAGIGLLNLFETAGLDASTAQKGLQKAVQALKPGQDLDDLIAQVASIEDPTKRAQEAMRIFGTRSGVGLANAIKPGQESLDDFKVSAEEAAGASEQAAEDMLTTSDKIKMFAEKAGAALRGFGQDLGPLVSGLGAIGTLAAPFAGKLKDLFGVLAKSGPIKAAAAAVGAMTGAAQAAAHEIAATGAQAVASMKGKIMGWGTQLAPAGTAVGTIVGGAIAAGAAAATVGIGLVVADQVAQHQDEITDALLGQGESMRKAAVNFGYWVGEFVAEGYTEQDAIERAKAYTWQYTNIDSEAVYQYALHAGELAGTTLRETLTAAGVNAMTGFVESATPSAMAAGTSVGTVTGEALGAATAFGAREEFGRSAPGVAAQMALNFAAAADAEFRERGRLAGEGITESLSAAMTNAKSTHTLLDSINDLKDAIELYLTPRQQALELIGSNYVKTLKTGMQSQDEDFRTAAQDLAIGAIATIEQAGLTGKKGQKGLRDVGILYDELLATGMTAQQVATALIAAHVGSDVVEKLTGVKIQTQAETGGSNVGKAWMESLVAGISTKQWMLTTKLANIDRMLSGNSPPPEGPLKNLDKGAANVGRAWIEGMAKSLSDGAKKISVALPTLNPGSGLAPAYAGGSMGAASAPITVNAYGYTPDDIERELARAQRRQELRASLVNRKVD